MSNYLRNRPFMVITYTYVLAEGQKTNVPSFMATAQWEPIENMVICDRVSDRQLQRAELVIDIFENKVIKSRDNTLDHDGLIRMFVSRHYNDVKAALATWVQKDPIANLSKVQAFVERFKTKTAPTAVAIEAGLNGVARQFLLELNTPETREKVATEMMNYLGTQGLKDFTVRCDDVNNTPERIDACELWADASILFEGDEAFTYIPIRITREAVYV